MSLYVFTGAVHCAGGFTAEDLPKSITFLTYITYIRHHFTDNALKCRSYLTAVYLLTAFYKSALVNADYPQNRALQKLIKHCVNKHKIYLKECSQI